VAADGSPRRESWDQYCHSKSRGAAKEIHAGFFFRCCWDWNVRFLYQGLTPWTTSWRYAAANLYFSFLLRNLAGKRGLPSPAAVVNIARPNKVHFMADVANKYPENTGGKYYVDNQCIDCDLCRETAPDNFKRNDDGGYSFVYKQPENPDEEARCKEAKEGCPVEAIGDNGG
jgi:ferredoxin